MKNERVSKIVTVKNSQFPATPNSETDKSCNITHDGEPSPL